MKLLNKTSLIIVTVALFIFFLGGIGFYKIIQTMIINQVDHELVVQQHNIVRELNGIQKLDNAYIITENKIQLKKIGTESHLAEIFKDTVLFDGIKELYVPYRLLQFHAYIGDDNYQVSVFRSMLEAESLIEKIVITMTVMLLSLILTMYFLNRYFFQKIWDDFFLAIGKVKKYNLRDDPNLELPYSEVEEFQTLNGVFEKLTERIHKDYVTLKEFTENASHEIQTPLSIMRAKIELLLQHPNYSDEQIALISSLNEAVNRLSNINKALILLTRIENNQFPELSKVLLRERIDYHIENFKDIIEARDIIINLDLNSDIKISINTALADILIINLLKNAIRHNHDNGSLSVLLTDNSLQISNTGPKFDIPAEQLFNRFVKAQNSSDSLGLGLSLAKKICELYGFDIQYTFADEQHKLTVNFEQTVSR